jgi:hypothetical protein
MTNGTCHSGQTIAAAKVVRRGPVRNEYPQEQPGPPANLFKTREAGCGRQTVPSTMSVTGGITGWRSTGVRQRQWRRDYRDQYIAGERDLDYDDDHHRHAPIGR